jgi:hypothetical protein
MRSRNASRILFTSALALAMALPFLSLNRSVSADTGSIFTANSSCGGVNINLFTAKVDVYLNGGPNSPNAPGLPDGSYYVQVTDPSGATLLGKTLTPSAHVTNGTFDQCYQLSDILYSASSGFTAQGYDTTPNTGHEYKVWVSKDPAFPGGSNKTDNFKVIEEIVTPPQNSLTVLKFYDFNANGVHDAGEPALFGWEVEIQDGIDLIRFTPSTVTQLDPDAYTVSEFSPGGTWIAKVVCVTDNNTNASSCDTTTPTTTNVSVGPDDDFTVEFGNYCTVPSGGLSKGYWSNRNGQAVITAADLCYLTSLNLKNANGTDFDPVPAGSCPALTSTQISAGKAALVAFFTNASSATNMANMLSAQFAAMVLNVRHGVDKNAFDLCSGQTINSLLNAANTSLGLYPSTPAGNPNRAAQEAMKNCLDKLDNGGPVVPVVPCPYSFQQ